MTARCYSAAVGGRSNTVRAHAALPPENCALSIAPPPPREAEEVTMSDTDLPGHPLPDITHISLASLFTDSAVLAAGLRRRLLTPDLPAPMAVFDSQIGGDECVPSSTNSF